MDFISSSPVLVRALARLKSYLVYGIFSPIQVMVISALEGDQICVEDACEIYRQRRDVLCDGLNLVS